MSRTEALRRALEQVTGPVTIEAVRAYALLALSLACGVLVFLIVSAPTDPASETPTGTTWTNGSGDLTEVHP